MFGILRIALRSFALGVAVGVLFAPRTGAETRRMLGERFAMAVNGLLDFAALPPVPPERARTNGHAERTAGKKPRTSMDARASS